MAMRKVSQQRRKNRSRLVGGFPLPEVIWDEYGQIEAELTVKDRDRNSDVRRKFYSGRAA